MKVITDAGVIEIGTTEAAPTIGLTDYSRRETDDFGVTTVVKRNFSRTMSARVMVPTANVDALQRQLAALRAKPVQWVADDRFDSLSITGFYKDLSIDLAIPPVSYCTLTIEGLAEGADYADPGTDPATDQRKSTLRLLRPATIDDAVLTSSNVPENDYPAWSASATYALGARVILSTTHRIYESAANGNVGNDPTGAAGQWIDIAPTNRWAMFDQALGSQTERASSIVVSLDPVDPIDAVALLDVTAASVRVQASGYDRTLSPAIQPGAVTFLDLPATAGAVTITISGSGTVSAGTLLIGKLLGLGTTEASPTAAITDYSRKETDAFGEVTVVERAWAKRMDVKSLISTAAVDVVAARIANVRAMPALWIGDATLESLAIYGFFKDFSIAVDEHVSTLSLSIEGLSTAAKLAPLGADVSWSDIKDDDPAHPKPEDGATVGATPEQVEQIADAQFTADAAAVAIAAAQAQIAAIQSSVTADFSAVNQAVDALNLDVSGVRSDITSLEQQAAGIIASIGDVGVEVAQLTTDLATANSNIGINAQAITSVRGSVAQLSSTVQAHDASIITNAQAIGALGSDLAILTTRVTAGGPNLQPNGGLENGLVGMSYVAGAGWQVGSGPKSGQSVATFIAPANGDVSIGWPLVPMEGGIEITVSANMSFSADGGVAFLLVEAFDALGAHLGWSPERHQAASFDWSADESRRALTATTWTTPAGTANIRVYFVARPVGNMTFAGASQLMVQRGPHWSAFSSEASIVQSFQALSTLDASYASLSTTVASHDGSIATLQQSYSGLNGTLAQLSSTVQAHDASIITLQQASSNQAGQLVQLSIDLATANSNISFNAQSIDTTNSNVAQLTSTVQAHDASILTNAQAIGVLGSNLAILTTEVRAGGQSNLVKNGSGENGLANWTFSGAGWGSTVSGSWGSVILNYGLGSSEQYSVADSDIFQVWAGELTFALETVLMNSEGVGWARGELVWLDASQNALFTSFGPSRAANHDFTQDNSGRRALTWTIVVPSGAAFARARVVFYRPSGSITVAAFRQAKVEAGAIASTYSSEASIVQSFQVLSALNNSYASLSSTVSVQDATITAQSTAISTLQGNVTSLFAKSSLMIEAGNVITGWENSTNGQTSSFRIRADIFELVPSSGSGARTEYSNGNWRVYHPNGVLATRNGVW